MSAQIDQVRSRLTVSPRLVITVWPGRLEFPIAPNWTIERDELSLVCALSTGTFHDIPLAIASIKPTKEDNTLQRMAARLRKKGGIITHEGCGTEPSSQSIPEAFKRIEIAADDDLRLEAPISLSPSLGKLQLLGHEGSALVQLSVDEALCLPLLASSGSAAELQVACKERCNFDEEAFITLCQRLHHARLLRINKPDEIQFVVGEAEKAQQRAFTAVAKQTHEDVKRKEENGAPHKTRVIPVSFTNGPPLALGLIYAHCEANDGGRLKNHFDFRYDWEWDDERLAMYTEKPAIYLCSVYVWSHLQVLAVAKSIKKRSPQSLIIVGGPDAPKREAATQDYLAQQRDVDIVVRGEGEESAFELLAALAPDPSGMLNLAAAKHIAGVTVRLGEDVFRGPDRDRLKDLNIVPSPFLTGIFDTYKNAPLDQVIIETNRGSPYGCTFCDWGSATQSRVRKYDIDRVYAEIAWSAQAKTHVLSLADANFGVYARDVEITEAVVAAKNTTTYPRSFGANFAKNTVKHLGIIIRTLVDGGIMNRGLLALQTMDQSTLDTIDRSNIPVAKYEGIAAEMRAAGLPFAVELMVGLPGSTIESFKNDLQQCIDREVEGTVNPTSVLVNSPMNAPSYLQEHGIETASPVSAGQHAILVATSSFTRAEYDHMLDLRHTFLLAENFGLTRHLNRLVRFFTGELEIDFLEKFHAAVVCQAVDENSQRYPVLSLLFERRGRGLIPVANWRLAIDEMLSYISVNYPQVDAASLETVGQVQHALLPAFDRLYPERIELAHDYAAWFTQLLALKENGHRSDWQEVIAPLASYGPGELNVDDPNRNARKNIGCIIDHGSLLASWEHASEVGRALFLA